MLYGEILKKRQAIAIMLITTHFIQKSFTNYLRNNVFLENHIFNMGTKIFNYDFVWNKPKIISKEQQFQLHCNLNTRIYIFSFTCLYFSSRTDILLHCHPTYSIFKHFITSGSICILSLLIYQNLIFLLFSRDGEISYF